jgi:hypothetical protein
LELPTTFDIVLQIVEEAYISVGYLAGGVKGGRTIIKSPVRAPGHMPEDGEDT